MVPAATGRLAIASPNLVPGCLPSLQVKGELGDTHMQVDGEPWRQPIPAAPDARRPRPAGLQQSGGSATGTPPAAAAGGGSERGERQRVVVHVRYAGQSLMLLNGEDPQGIRRARNLTVRSAQVSRPLKARYSFLDRTVPAA